jgi:hypothetical protein
VQCADQEIRFLQTPSPTDLPLPDLPIMLACRRPDGGPKRRLGSPMLPGHANDRMPLNGTSRQLPRMPSKGARRTLQMSSWLSRRGRGRSRRVAATLSVSCDPSGSSASGSGVQSTLPRHSRRSHDRICHTSPISKHWAQPQPRSSPRSSLERCRHRSKLKFLYFARGGSRHVGQDF